VTLAVDPLLLLWHMPSAVPDLSLVVLVRVDLDGQINTHGGSSVQPPALAKLSNFYEPRATATAAGAHAVAEWH
jgi:hypothetical protein